MGHDRDLKEERETKEMKKRLGMMIVAGMALVMAGCDSPVKAFCDSMDKETPWYTVLGCNVTPTPAAK
jgi:hypothetical protein